MSAIKIRILVVDDSVVIRKLLTETLASDPEIEVAGVAANGKIALAKIPQINPDLVTMDVEMPELNGLETVRELRKTWPKLPVIMFSTLTKRGSEATLDALAAGATDYVNKPANVGSVQEAIARIRQELIPKIHTLVRKHAPSVSAAGHAVTRFPAITRPKLRHDIHVLAIGCSTGGPNALALVLPSLPRDFPVPVVIVQHMPPVFTRSLADRLSAKSAIPVVEASDGMALAAGHAYIAPGDFHITFERVGVAVHVRTSKGPPENSCRPAVDVMFRSAAEVYGAGVLALVMTGMGYDGWRGSEHIHNANGTIFVQDEASSVVWGMPGQIATTGLADKVLPLEQIALELCRRVSTTMGTFTHRGGFAQ